MRKLFTAILLLTASQAHAITIDAFDQGWYDSRGVHIASNVFTYTGSGGTYLYNSFYNFDLGGINDSLMVSTASINFVPNGGFATDTGTETLQLWNVTTAAGDTDAADATDIYQDLMSGTLYGQQDIALPATNNGFGSMPFISMVLNSSALLDLNNLLFSTDIFRIGAHLSSVGDTYESGVFWNGGHIAPAAYLSLELTERPAAAPLPSPSPLALTAAGLFGFMLNRSRRASL